ncbi:MAG TPA: metallophosphoesterase, partial [Anaerolineae bacterium]|nr:metallophosphoesterase [Anaerolineae bacterium]
MANQARRVSGCVIAGMGIAILAVMATHAPPAKAAGPVLIRGPYLQSVTATSAIVVWRTDGAGDTQVDYGVGSYTYSISDTTIGTEHVASLASLVTGTEVMYRILTNGTQLYAGSFRTAVDVDTTFSFAVLGDSGVGSTAQYSIANVMTSLDPMFVLHTGDVIYPSGQYEGYDPFFFAPYQTLLRRAPMFLSLGNHDYGTLSGQPYLDT